MHLNIAGINSFNINNQPNAVGTPTNPQTAILSLLG